MPRHSDDRGPARHANHSRKSQVQKKSVTFRHESPKPKIRRCFYCRRRGVRTHECHCRRTRVTSISTNKDRYDTGVLLTVEGKKVRAVVNTDYQETRISQGVLEFLRKKRPLNLTKKVLHSAFGIETLHATTVTISLDRERHYALECYVDSRVRKN